MFFLPLLLSFQFQVGQRNFTPAGGGTSISLVRSASSTSVSGFTVSPVYTSNTAGDISVVGISWCSSTGNAVTISTVTDTAGNSYTVRSATLATVTATHYSNCDTEFATATGIVASAGTNTVSVTFSAAPALVLAGIWELSAGSFDQSNVGTNTNTDLPTPGSITTAHNGSFYVAIGIIDDGYGGGPGWFSAVSPFTLSGQGGGGSADTASEYYAQTTAGAQAAAFSTVHTTFTGPNAGSVVSFHP